MSEAFDRVRDRRGSNSMKWDGLETLYKDPDAIAMWVADMDFDTAPVISRNLTEVASNQVLGYTKPSDTFLDTYIKWQDKHDMNLRKQDILLSPDVISGLGVVIQSFSDVDDAVMIHDPAYNGFTPIIENNHRQLLRSPLKLVDGKYEMDYEDIDRQMTESPVKIFIISNPHNPGGKVWDKEDLTRLADLCKKHEVILVSDEIHCDLVYNDKPFVSAFNLDEKYFDRIIIMHSATKTFNIAGTKAATMLIKDRDLRDRVKEVQSFTAQSTVNTFGLVAMETAFSECDEWHQDLLAYLDSNRQLITDFFDKELPDVEYMVPEATYLFWFNAEQIGLTGDDLKLHFVEKGQVALVSGSTYGESSPTWIRMNFGTSKERLEKGLAGIKQAFEAAK